MVSGVLYTAFYPVFILTILDGIYIIILAMIKREEDVFPMAAGMMLLIGTAVFDMILDRDLLPSHFVYQMDKGMIGFIFVQAYIITLRINRAYENEKRFREALQDHHIFNRATSKPTGTDRGGGAAGIDRVGYRP